MDLDGHRSDLRQRIAQRIGVVGECTSIEHHSNALVGRLVQPLDKLRLRVGLPYVDIEAEVRTPVTAGLRQLLMCRVTVDLRLPDAQAPQVGSVEDEHTPTGHDATSA